MINGHQRPHRTAHTDGADDGCGVFFSTEGVGLLACDESCLSALTTDALLEEQRDM